MNILKCSVIASAIFLAISAHATSIKLQESDESFIKPFHDQKIFSAADMGKLTEDQMDKLKTNPWPQNVTKAFNYRQEYYRSFLGDQVELYSKITDDFPNVITFWAHSSSDWKSLQNSQLSITDDIELGDTSEAAYSLTVLQSRFEDQGYVLSESHRLKDTDTKAIGLDVTKLSDEDQNRVVELVMQQGIPDESGHQIGKPLATITITLLPQIKDGKLSFSNVGIFYTEEQQKKTGQGA